MSDSAVLERLDDLEYLLKSHPVREYVDTAFVAQKLGCTAQHLRDNPWLLPNHGVYDFPAKRTWHFQTVRAWLDAPVAVHQAEWDALPAATKKAVADKRRRG